MQLPSECHNGNSLKYPASHVKPKATIDNLYSPLYYGDLNVTEGKQFSIRCWAEPPISWFKDGEPIEKHFIRHNALEQFSYTLSDHPVRDLKGKVESTLTVSHAILRHKGKYQCNVNHHNAHVLNVHPAPRVALESDESFDTFEAENDHEEQRMSFETPLEGDRPIASTMMIFTGVVTQAPRVVETPYVESNLDYDEEKSHEKFIDEPTTLEEIESSEYESTVQMLPTSTKTTTSSSTTTTTMPTTKITTSSPSLTNIPFHPTHANHVVHTTHEIPSEVKTQNHHKGSQKMTKMIRKSFRFLFAPFRDYFDRRFLPYQLIKNISRYLVLAFVFLNFAFFLSINFLFV